MSDKFKPYYLDEFILLVFYLKFFILLLINIKQNRIIKCGKNKKVGMKWRRK